MAVRKEAHQTTITRPLWTTGEPRMGSHTADPKAAGIFIVGRRDSLFSALSSPGFALYRVLLVAHQTWRLPKCWEVFLGCVQQQHLLWELKHLLQRRMWLWGLILTVFQGLSTQKTILNGFIHPGVSLYLIRTFQNHSRPHFHLEALWVFKSYIILVVAKVEWHKNRRGTGYPNFG